ncbi:hypothetical protein GCM10010253_28820 [Streptomyces badius]|uniref:Acyl-CoA dehydrogenase n=1 Tax=Streptomyces badius TaxID=1941 RepID=A0ABQ2T6V6_STRBA|nr:hypothetical protein GCM10010253_28820 [Streptomyces badius]
MDFTFTEEQRAAVEAARAVFSDVAPDRAPSPALAPGAVAEDIDRQLWHELARTDLLGLTLSPADRALPRPGGGPRGGAGRPAGRPPARLTRSGSG